MGKFDSQMNISHPLIIQGGMGAGVSDWRLARAVSQTGQLGVVSGTAVAAILARRLQVGDPGGHMRRALEHFPIPGVAAHVFKAIADANINVDMIVQNISHNQGAPATDISFTVDKPELLKAKKVIESLKEKIGFRDVIADEKIGKLSIVGVGMRSNAGVAAKMFETLANNGINIDMISTSEIKISVVIELTKGEQAMRVIHEAFLGK